MSLPINALKPPVSESSSRSAGSKAGDISAAYDALASDYDSQLASAKWIRDRLWERMDSLFQNGSQVLDATAGTGLDALHLAGNGVSVTACDISPAMLFQLHRKNPNIETRLCDFSALDLHQKFDGIISTFAGLNTTPDLRPFANSAAHMLRPGGILFIHVLNRWSLLDIARHLIKLRWRAGFQALIFSRRDVKLGSFVIPHYLVSPHSLYRQVFATHFQLRRINGQGIIRPLNVNWGAHLEGTEKWIASTYPFQSMGIFFSMEMARA